ncbi:MAG: hypothetical protein HKN10_16290, partial [Myxococcales bacterium]|nr:hypothetical protein [Myxococcales bacterium]
MTSIRDEHSSRKGRRRFVLGTLGLGGGTLLAALSSCRKAEPPAPSAPAETKPTPVPPELPDRKDPANFIRHGDNPLTLETRREKLGTSVLTASTV